jgi:hypothetical protein
MHARSSFLVGVALSDGGRAAVCAMPDQKAFEPATQLCGDSA